MSSEQTYYSASANPARHFPRLESDLEADVCVVGGGIAGCSVALHLAQRGYRVVLLESQDIGWAASGRSGGQGLPGYACGQSFLIEQARMAQAQPMWDMSVEAAALLRELVQRHKIESDLQQGRLQVAIKARQRADLVAELELLQRKFGYQQLQLLERNAVREQLASERYIAGLLDRGSAHLHPLNYTLGLAAAAADAGVAIYEHTPAIRVDMAAPAVVQTIRGRVKARFVALCCNAYIAGLQRQLRARIMP